MEWIDVFFGSTTGIVGTVLIVLALVMAVAFITGYLRSPYALGASVLALAIGFLCVCVSAGVIDWSVWETIAKPVVESGAENNPNSLLA